MLEITSSTPNSVTVQVTIELTGSLMEMEHTILDACNAVGRAATGEALKQFDTDGNPIIVGEIKMTSKGQNNKDYQSPYGSVSVERHVYQSSQGGHVYCPLDKQARIIRGATPKFAQQVAHKYANLNAPAVCEDLAEAKEESWEYTIPKLEAAITTVVVSLDGAYLLMRDSGYREAMVGNISLYDSTFKFLTFDKR